MKNKKIIFYYFAKKASVHARCIFSNIIEKKYFCSLILNFLPFFDLFLFINLFIVIVNLIIIIPTNFYY